MSGLARSLIVIMGEMVVCWEEGVVVGSVERVEGVHYRLGEDVGGWGWGVVGGEVVLGEEFEPGFKGRSGSGVSQGEEAWLSLGCTDVVMEEETFEIGGEAEDGYV